MSWRQHPARHQLYGHLPPMTKTIQVRRTRHAGHCWRSRDELISDVLLWTPTYGRAKAGRPARTYIQQLCEDTGCSPEDLPEAMNNRERWRARVSGTTWWWWDNGFHDIPQGISPKVNGIEWLEFELAYYDSVVHKLIRKKKSKFEMCLLETVRILLALLFG